uniref:F5/8 type C domain-containing protein n=1 Tax=Astyanax mexicanus TaxID=7994 RepID=A0A3B1JJJ9_ASTMX
VGLNIYIYVFSLSGCYGTLGLESGVVSDAQISASSVWEWARHGEKPSVWASSGSRLKRAGLPWAAVTSDTKQWIQVDLKREKKITGNTNYLHEVRNNFIPPIEARFIRINPYQWHQRIALKMELLGCHVSTLWWCWPVYRFICCTRVEIKTGRHFSLIFR